MTDLLTYFNVNLLGLKPFHLNVFKTGIILFFLVISAWILASRSGFRRTMQLHDHLDHWSTAQHRALAWCMGGLFAAFLIYLRIRQYFELQTMWDMTVEANVAWHMVHGPWFFNTLDNRSFLGGHFSPVFLLIGLVYRLVEHPLTLLVVQSLALGLGAVAVYYLALLRCERKSLTILAVAFYIFNPYLHHSNAHDFHLSPLAIPTVLWLLVYVESGKHWQAAASALLALSIEESIPPPLAGLGLYLVTCRPGWRVFGTILAMCSIAYFFLAIKVLIPMFSPEHSPFLWERYANLGANFNEALVNILLNPIWTISEALVHHNQYVYLLYFLIPVAFLPFFTWKEACLLVIPLSIMLLSQNDGQYKLGFHYSAPTLPFLFYSAVYGLEKAARYFEQRAIVAPGRWNIVLVCVLFLLALNTYRCPGYDLGKTNPKFAASAFEIARLVPADAAVATDVRFAPLLVNRHRICKIGSELGALCDWTPVGAKVPGVAGGAQQQTDPQWIPEYVLIGAEPGKASVSDLEVLRAYGEWLKVDLGYEEVRNQDGIRLFRSSRIPEGAGG